MQDHCRDPRMCCLKSLCTMSDFLLIARRDNSCKLRSFFSFVAFQATDERTDRETNRQTNGQHYRVKLSLSLNNCFSIITYTTHLCVFRRGVLQVPWWLRHRSRVSAASLLLEKCSTPGRRRVPISRRDVLFQWHYVPDFRRQKIHSKSRCMSDRHRGTFYNQIRYDTVYLTCSKKPTCLCLPHRMNRKI